MQLFFNYLGNISHFCHLHQDRLCSAPCRASTQGGELEDGSAHRHNKSRGDASKGENRLLLSSLICWGHPHIITL